ncbi:MAG: PBP1A family penicillin-binding protein [Elusimicrobiota bacterium]|jgi:penicillin-binding protein 1B
MKSRRNGSFLRKILYLSLAVALVCAGMLAERSISPLLSGDVTGAYPTRIYSAPARLRAGDPLTEGELQSRLERLRYAASETPQPGTYSRKGSAFDIRMRGFSTPFRREEPSNIRVETSGGKILSVSLAGEGHPPLVEAWLEPELIYEISGEHRIRRERLEAADIPKSAADAVVAVEDRRFRKHHGVDPRSVLRALVKNTRQGRYAEGASTLTQQLARSLFLSPRRTLRRKAEEVLIALYLDARFSKDELLRMYLDTVYFGQDGPVSLLGLKAASKHFFDKPPSKLTLGESALLAGLLRSPYNYDPFRNPETSAARRKTVLAAMRREGFISAQEEAQAAKEPLPSGRPVHPASRGSDYFTAFVHRILESRYGDEALLTHGLNVYTTLDTRLQALAIRSAAHARDQAAIVVLDPADGAIRALVGGKDFAASPFDRASVARRQPGSAFKPLVFAAALTGGPGERRWTAASVLDDSPRDFPTSSADASPSIGPARWSPRNHEDRYLGRVSLRTALAQSLNLATLDLASQAGVRRISELARRLGVSSPLRQELGLALGSSELSLLELTGAYCAFANGGRRAEPYAVEAAMDPSGELLEYHAPASEPIFSQEESALLTDLLRETVRSGTARNLRRWGLENCSAGKTGTTNDGKDAWFIGYTPRLLAGVWVGSDLPTKLGLTGAKDALPLWAEFMAAASTASLQETWPAPEGLLSLEVDPQSGLLARSGCPERRKELFLPDNAPKQDCPLHAGGVKGWFGRFFSGKPAKKGVRR